MKCNGATFTAAQYPELAWAYPSLKLPDLRGEFIRGWSDDRNVDTRRALLSSQESTHFSEYAGNYPLGSGHAIFDYDGETTRQEGFSRFHLPGPSVGNGVKYVAIRPRNIAFNYIVRAA
ncbi:phage tail protein [Xenorhabdus bovienii]|nr:phage tail protein [Xenorhabdus bovienii]